MNLNNFIKKNKGYYVDVRGNRYKSPFWDSIYYRGQCASLVRRYLVDVHGLPDITYGNGNQFDDKLISMNVGFVNIGNNLKNAINGDILVWDNLGKYGHVAIYFNGKMFSANPNAAALIPIWAGVTDIIRPIVKVTTWKKPKRYVAKTNVRKRLYPSAKYGPIYGIFKKVAKPTIKNTLLFRGSVKKHGYTWYWYNNNKKQRTYVAAKHLKEFK